MSVIAGCACVGDVRHAYFSVLVALLGTARDVQLQVIPTKSGLKEAVRSAVETAPRDRWFDLNTKKSGWGCPRPVRLRRVKERAVVGCGLWGDGSEGNISMWGFGWAKLR